MRWWMNGMVSGGVPLMRYMNDAVLLEVALGRLGKEPISTPDETKKFTFRSLGPQADDTAIDGWMLVVADDAEGRAIEDALMPLVEHRIGARRRGSFAKRKAADVIRRYPGNLDEAGIGEWVMSELVLDKGGAEECAPYYTLIAGPPSKLPFWLEHHIHSSAAVGRLAFHHVDDYRRYVEKVLSWEPEDDPTKSIRSGMPLGVFATDHGYRDATHLSRTNLVEPIVAALQSTSVPGPILSRIGDDASAEALLGLLRGEGEAHSGPRVLFSATHGLAVSGADEEIVKRDRKSVV